jgi:hypothetical protein
MERLRKLGARGVGEMGVAPGPHILGIADHSIGKAVAGASDASDSSTRCVVECARFRGKIPTENATGVSCASNTCLWDMRVVNGLAPGQGHEDGVEHASGAHCDSRTVTRSDRSVTARDTSCKWHVNIGLPEMRDIVGGLSLKSEDTQTLCVCVNTVVAASRRELDTTPPPLSKGMHTTPSMIRSRANVSHGWGIVSCPGSMDPCTISKHDSEGFVAGVSITATAPSLLVSQHREKVLVCAVKFANET